MLISVPDYICCGKLIDSFVIKKSGGVEEPRSVQVESGMGRGMHWVVRSLRLVD